MEGAKRKMINSNRIYLVGQIGAGKGLVGKALADKLGWQFIDADFGLESHIGRPLSDILGKQGEESLHQCESEMLSRYLGKENIVVNTDAGIVSSVNNRKLLSSEFVVYLNVSTQVQLERNKSKSAPLLLQTGDFKDLLDKLHSERDMLYEELAKITINTDSGSLEQDVNKIIKAFETNITK